MTSSALQHLERLQALLQALGSGGIEIESHQYNCIAFGDFTLVLAKGHSKARFLWDGRESILTVEYQVVRNKSINGTWEHVAFIKAPSGETVFAEIESNAKALLQ